MKTVAGLEEAGRGPVIGPLVMAGILINVKDTEKLEEIGVKDSKLLTPQQREALFDKIIKITKKHEIIIVQPNEVDKALNSEDSNLNWLESEKTAEIINNLKPDTAIIDCPSTNIQAYTAHLQKNIHHDIKLIVEHKADVNHLPAAAASILAKVTRDREIEKLKKKINMDFGSGYPSDPKTAAFLKKYYKKFPNIFRKTWAPYKAVLKQKGQSKLKDF